MQKILWIPADLSPQANQSFDRTRRRRVLERLGSSLNQTVKTKDFLARISTFPGNPEPPGFCVSSRTNT